MISFKKYSKKQIFASILAGLASATLSDNALAQNISAPSFLSLSLGYYDVLDDQDGADFRVEYRPATSLYFKHLKPWGGVEVTSEGSIWAGGGVLYNAALNEQWTLTPAIGAGIYNDGSSDVNLDYPVQFKTQLELSYGMHDQSRWGLAISHISNAGLGDSNPGSEIMSVYWHKPIN